MRSRVRENADIIIFLNLSICIFCLNENNSVQFLWISYWNVILIIPFLCSGVVSSLPNSSGADVLSFPHSIRTHTALGCTVSKVRRGYKQTNIVVGSSVEVSIRISICTSVLTTVVASREYHQKMER